MDESRPIHTLHTRSCSHYLMDFLSHQFSISTELCVSIYKHAIICSIFRKVFSFPSVDVPVFLLSLREWFVLSLWAVMAAHH